MDDRDTTRRPTGLKETRELVRDLFSPRPGIYWPDFLLATALGWAAFVVCVQSGSGALRAACGFVAVLSLYRALLFIHELTHLAADALPGFRVAWNLLIGIPLLVPSFAYVGVHTDHHRRTIYGTAKDPEYLPLARGPRWRVAWFLAESLLAPLLFVLRFVVVAPFALLVPPFHRWLERSASSLVINPAYRRREFTPVERRRVLVVEAAMLLVWGGAIAAVVGGVLPARLFLVWYLVSGGIAVVNQVRTLAAHRFRNDGRELDVIDQLEDSVNIPNGALAMLWAPVGLRYHALHHYLPDLPYHALGEAHRRLLARLPAEAPYRKVNGRSLPDVVATIWREAGDRSSPCPSSTSTAS